MGVPIRRGLKASRNARQEAERLRTASRLHAHCRAEFDSGGSFLRIGLACDGELVRFLVVSARAHCDTLTVSMRSLPQLTALRSGPHMGSSRCWGRLGFSRSGRTREHGGSPRPRPRENECAARDGGKLKHGVTDSRRIFKVGWRRTSDDREIVRNFSDLFSPDELALDLLTAICRIRLLGGRTNAGEVLPRHLSGRRLAPIFRGR